MEKLSPSMATFLCFLILPALAAASARQQRHTNISHGSSLTPTNISSWFSPSGLYAFGFYELINRTYAVGIFLAGIPEKTVVWTVNRNDPIFPSNSVLILRDDGRLILKQEGKDDVIIANPGQVLNASASMLDNGNFVLYDLSRRIIWQSFDYPTDTILPGQRLSPGQEIISSVSETNPGRGIYRLKMQTDGNLVQYPVDTPDTAPYSFYTSYTYRTGNNVSLNLDDNGNLYLLNGSSVLKNITTGRYRPRTIYRMRIDVDGIFRVYSRLLDPQGNWTREWSPTENKCISKGLCGLNGYCRHTDESDETAVQCECLPGFNPVSLGNWTSGCERNFAMEGCKAKDQSVSYEISSLQNSRWPEDTSYAVYKE